MPEIKVKLGPADHGRRMSLAEFDQAHGEPGHHYELCRGIVNVVEIPNPRPHFALLMALKRQLLRYDDRHPGVIYGVATGSECKIMLTETESERHPDLAIYKTEPPEEDVWATWIPEIVIEIISPASVTQDYTEKREDYSQFGIREYWIVDAEQGQLLALRRHGGRWREKVIRPPEKYTTKLLPGFELDLAAVFAAAASGRPS